MENIFITALENEKRKIDSMQGNWGLTQVSKLNNLLEEKDIYISNNLWDLLLFNIKNLYCNNDKISIEWRKNQSKKVVKLIRENYKLIVNNYNNIMSPH